MAERQSIRTVDSETVQGAGSFIKVRSMTRGYVRKIKKQLDSVKDTAKRADLDNTLSDAMLIDHIAAWNWVDDEGQPLPLPKEDAAVLDALTVDEIRFITEALQGSAAERKNS